MDFFTQQNAAKTKTQWLIAYFFLATVLTVALTYLIIAVALKLGHKSSSGLWSPQIFVWSAGATLAVIATGSIIKILLLRSGGAVVASALGGVPLSPGTRDPDEIKLRNVVEEMALASGVPVPEIFIMPEESGINAFAAGHDTRDAVVCVTAGAIRQLTRDELQGVIAHEFSHILNGDMLLNLRLTGWIHGILGLSLLGQFAWNMAPGSGRRSRDDNVNWALFAIGLALVIAGSIGAFFGRLIKAAVSRQREFLADASAVQFTRNPLGLAGALKKIGGLEQGSTLHAAQAEEFSHLYFSSGVDRWSELFATHPPLVDRIRVLDPSFDGNFPKVAHAAEEIEQPEENLRPLTRAASSPALSPRDIFKTMGRLSAAQIVAASNLRASYPDAIEAAARDPFDACALTFALLFSDDPAIRDLQLKSGIDESILQRASELYPSAAALTPAQRLPLLDLAVPALRQMSSEQFESFSNSVKLLVEIDHEISLFEYAAQRILLRHLQPHFEPPAKPVIQYYVLKPVLQSCAVLLSALAQSGYENENEREAAFALGVEKLKIRPGELVLLDDGACPLTEVDRALDCLNQVAPILKRQVLEACAEVVAADGLVQEAEAELLRAIADSLDCPIPPVLGHRVAETTAA